MTNQDILRIKAIKENDAKQLVESYQNEIKYNQKHCFELLAGCNMKKAKKVTRYLSISHIKEIVDTCATLPMLATGYYRYRESFAPGHFNLYVSEDDLDVCHDILFSATEKRKMLHEAYKVYQKDKDFDQLIQSCEDIKSMVVHREVEEEVESQ